MRSLEKIENDTNVGLRESRATKDNLPDRLPGALSACLRPRALDRPPGGRSLMAGITAVFRGDPSNPGTLKLPPEPIGRHCFNLGTYGVVLCPWTARSTSQFPCRVVARREHFEKPPITSKRFQTQTAIARNGDLPSRCSSTLPKIVGPYYSHEWGCSGRWSVTPVRGGGPISPIDRIGKWPAIDRRPTG
jgi:hypothetical protein